MKKKRQNSLLKLSFRFQNTRLKVCVSKAVFKIIFPIFISFFEKVKARLKNYNDQDFNFLNYDLKLPVNLCSDTSFSSLFVAGEVQLKLQTTNGAEFMFAPFEAYSNGVKIMCTCRHVCLMKCDLKLT